MSYSKQGLFELNSILPFGKHKGKSIARVYSGDASGLVSCFLNLMDKSLSLILSKEIYDGHDKTQTIDVSSFADLGELGDAYSKDIVKLVLAMRTGALCNYKVTSKKVKITVKDGDGNINLELSRVACEVAQEYITRSFSPFLNWDARGYRPDFIVSSEVDYQEEIGELEGDPGYIMWCVKKVDGFCLRGDNREIFGLNSLPVFTFDSIGVAVKPIKESCSFKFAITINAQFEKIPKDIVELNAKKYSSYLEQQNTPYYPEEVCDSEEYSNSDSDDDEDNIMRGLESGNGDQFGF